MTYWGMQKDFNWTWEEFKSSFTSCLCCWNQLRSLGFRTVAIKLQSSWLMQGPRRGRGWGALATPLLEDLARLQAIYLPSPGLGLLGLGKGWVRVRVKLHGKGWVGMWPITEAWSLLASLVHNMFSPEHLISKDKTLTKKIRYVDKISNAFFHMWTQLLKFSRGSMPRNPMH